MIAIIPCGGCWHKFKPHTYTQPKSLIPVAGKPMLLGFIIDQLLDNGITEFVFVIGYLGEKNKRICRHEYPTIQKNI